MSCYVCRASLTDVDMELADEELPDALREQQFREEREDINVPRLVVPLCHSRLGPPPDFARLRDRRMQWSQISRSWSCLSCSREVFEDDILNFMIERPYCSTHQDVMCMCVDYIRETQYYACGYGGDADVQLVRHDCVVGVPPPSQPQLVDDDLESDLEDGAAQDLADWQAELSELQGIVAEHMFSEELSELTSLVNRHLVHDDSV